MMLETLFAQFDEWLRIYDAWYHARNGCGPSENLRGWEMGVWYNTPGEWLVGVLWQGEAEEPLGEGETLLSALLDAAKRIEEMKFQVAAWQVEADAPEEDE